MNLSTGLIRLQRIGGAKLADARTLRRNMTGAETKLWEHLRNRNLGGFKFRRQQIVEGFIADFYCETAKLALEIDGSVHSEKAQMEIDELREKVFGARGILTFRIGNKEVEDDLTAVLLRIRHSCDSRSTIQQPGIR